MKKTVVQTLAAIGLVLSMSASAQAAAILVTTPLVVKFSDDTNPLVGSSSTLSGVPGEGTVFAWNVDGFGSAEFTFIVSVNHNNSLDRIFMTTPATTLINKGGNFGTRQLFNVADGSVVDGSPSLSYSTDSNTANIISRTTSGTNLTFSGTVVGFNTTNPGFIAFSFAGQNGTQFGWAEISFSTGVDGGLTITQWGYETAANTPINVGDGSPVPEPSTYALGLGLLALGAAVIRRRRS